MGKLALHVCIIVNIAENFNLMKYLFLFLAAIICFACTEGTKSNNNGETIAIKGKISCNGAPLSDVLITDGYTFAKSNQKGEYSLKGSKDAQYVSVVTPAGYTTDYRDGVPNFYIEVSSSIESYDFDLIEWGSSDSYALITIGDIQYANQEHLDRFSDEVYPDIKKYVEEKYLINGVKPVLITLGDITWDNFKLYKEYVELISTMPAPFYPVIGNHDYDQYTQGDNGAAHVYNHFFGPTYYAFNLGKDYYIVLDNIVYDTQKKYEVTIDTTQQNWVKEYLKSVPKGSNVYLCMHSPVKVGSSTIDKKFPEWIGIFDEYELSIISGHTHLLFNKETIPGVFEHNVGAACGSWWTSDIGRDGAPIGYQIFESSNNQPAEWRYKSVGYDDDFQIKLYGAGEVESQPNSVVAYIWAVDNDWNIKGWFDNVEVKAVRDTLTNPDYEAYLKETGEDVGSYKKPALMDSYFVFEVPTGAPKTFRIEAIDKFGNKYEEALEL